MIDVDVQVCLSMRSVARHHMTSTRVPGPFHTPPSKAIFHMPHFPSKNRVETHFPPSSYQVPLVSLIIVFHNLSLELMQLPPSRQCTSASHYHAFPLQPPVLLRDCEVKHFRLAIIQVS